MLNSSQVAFERSGLALRQIVRRWCVAAAATSLFYSALAPALGLGDITLHSALEQPFNADIELVDTAGVSADDIRVSLASQEVFDRAGIDRLFFLNDLRFTTAIDGNRGVVHVVSKKAVSEPYLRFVVRLARPNGDLVHTYTVLLDPADSPLGRAATRGRWVAPAHQRVVDVNMPVAPPQAVQGNHYTVVSGDNLNSIVHLLQGPGNKVPAADLAKGIQALNTQAFSQGSNSRLTAGQSLLLPDIAVLPASLATPPASTPATVPTSSVPAVLTSEEQKTAEQLATNAIENQQLNKTVDDLKGQLHGLEDQVSNKDKQVAELQTQLSALKSAANKPPAPAVIAPVAPAPVVPVDDSFVSTPLLLGALGVLLALLGVAYSVRRKRQKIAPVQALNEGSERRIPIVPTVPVRQAPRVIAAAPVAPASVPAVAPVVATPAPVTPRIAGAATDALDGASIYIAYGRFSEALGVLRDAAHKQPERSDLRLRILELLGEQGDAEAFAVEEQSLLDHGISPQKVAEIRARYPQFQAKSAPVAVPEPMPVQQAVAPEPVPETRVEQPIELTPVAEPTDEFHLNLDDLSLDADWDLVDPFDTTPPARSKNVSEHEPTEPAPEFSTNLTQLPEVFEMPDEQFLSDFAEADEPVIHASDDNLSDEFLDTFMHDSQELDLVDLSEEPSSKIHHAQTLIDEGEWDHARELLLEVIADADEEHRREAKQLLAGIS